MGGVGGSASEELALDDLDEELEALTAPAPLDNVTKALALARIGIKVFPVDKATRAPKLSEKDGGRGFYDATSDDFEQIATWFTLDFPESKTAVGVWMGGSGLAAADLDRGKKNGKDGFVSLKAAGREVSETENYPTASGGEHHIWQTDRLDLAPGTDVLGMEGVDIRAGGSYIVWWGDTVPETRDAFSTGIPDWMIEAATASETSFSGEGFSGGVNAWLEAIPDDALPSGKIRDLLARIPKADFGHPEMVDLAWAIVRMGSERETGVKMALDALRKAWLRKPYNTAKNRRDFDLAVKGAILKAGRVQRPVPAMAGLAASMNKATELGVATRLKALERKVSETGTEIDFARARREMFRIAAEAGLSPANALGIVTGSKSFKHSKVSVDSAWFGDGEPSYHDIAAATEAEEASEEAAEQEKIDREVELAKRVNTLSSEAEAFSFLTPGEKTKADAYDWFGNDYLKWVQTRLKHFNKPYHVGSMWAALSTIASPWGKVPLQGAKATDCNLYFNILGDSSSGKSEAWGFGKAMIDAFYGIENSPIIADAKKSTALSIHRTLILRDGQPSLVYSDEVQSFFEDLKTSHWQGSILGDLSDYYGGDVPPKNTMNDKEISGKRASTLLTTYFTGIADMTLDAVSIGHWKSGFFYRYLWGFGNPRKGGDYEIKLELAAASYTTQFETWARELKRVGALQEVKWGAGRIVDWEENALKRMSAFNKQLDESVKSSPLYDSVFIAANGRFLNSIMKCATLVAMSEAAEKVSLDHVLVALSYAGPWHRAMVLAVSETGKEAFDREVEKCLVWIKRNAIRQVGKPAWIQRSAVMRAFKPNEIADRLLRQLTEEGWLVRSGDKYELSEG